MTTPNILYSKSKFHWLRDYPDQPKQAAFEDYSAVEWRNYNEGTAKSLASAIEFVKEDQVRVRKLVWAYPKYSGASGDSEKHHQESLEGWEPKDGQLFTVEGIDTEETTRWRKSEKEEWKEWHESKGSKFSCQMVRLKAKPKKPNNIIKDLASPPEEHVFKATITATGRKVWQYWYTDRNDLNQHSGYFDDRRDALTHYKNRLGIKDSAPPEPKGEWRVSPNGFGELALVQTDGRALRPTNFSKFTEAELQAIADKLNESTLPSIEESLWDNLPSVNICSCGCGQLTEKSVSDLKIHLTRRIDSENEKQG